MKQGQAAAEQKGRGRRPSKAAKRRRRRRRRRRAEGWRARGVDADEEVPHADSCSLEWYREPLHAHSCRMNRFHSTSRITPEVPDARPLLAGASGHIGSRCVPRVLRCRGAPSQLAPGGGAAAASCDSAQISVLAQRGRHSDCQWPAERRGGLV